MSQKPEKKPTSFSQKTKLIIALTGRGSCTICTISLVVSTDDGQIAHRGEAAHIAGDKPGAARFDPSMTDAQRSDAKNGIYVCLDCHDKIDNREPENYPAEKLLNLKSEHEKRMDAAIATALGDVNFVELKLICDHLLDFVDNDNSGQTPDLGLIKIEEKIRLNDLSEESRRLITMGLSLEQTVQNFIDTETLKNSQFAIKLRDGFRAEYYKQKTNDLSGDALYMSLIALAGRLEPKNTAAVIAVLAYLFEKCEVFER